MHSCGAMDENLGSLLIQSLQREIHTALKNVGRVRLEVIVNRIPQHCNPMRLSQRRVVKFNLHVENVCYARASHLCHVLRGPNATPDRNSTRHPSHIHLESPVWQVFVKHRGPNPQVAALSQSRGPTASRRRPLLSNLRPLIDFHSTASLAGSA